LTGLEVVVTRLLASPHMAFKVELGTTPMGNKFRLSDYEVASRISFKITGTLPDSQLFAAAANGELQELSEVRSQIRRLLKTEKAHDKKKEMIAYYTALHNVATPNSYAANKAGISTSGLKEEMQKELLDFADHVISGRSGSFYDLMTSDQVFPLS